MVPPSNFKAARDVQFEPPVKAMTGTFLQELLKTLSGFFQPSTGQIFALQFAASLPSARSLWLGYQQRRDTWSVRQAHCGQRERIPLVDQFYNVGEVIGAPNGINLSIVY
ncbi:hypothetical protein M413DRAFT_27917 [Hebeloma cylindrosporum]|uniref:Uncharacterized protein n=1 Tax=Hebeloma cylindrosporum TaxID=76867 RepID=A0A0C2YKS9_HEBCY|nr:hypothetical protein M413DRAFT_27917 [Hebeloma cylindrosporum h7]